MTVEAAAGEPRRSRWLPITVFSLFALIFAVDAVVIVLYGNYRNLIEEDGMEMVFEPASLDADDPSPEVVELAAGSRIVAPNGSVMVAVSEEGLEVRAPGELMLRFRAPDAGSYVTLDYRFGDRLSGARCDLILARVASRYGADTMCRRSFVAVRKPKGRFRHYLADHAGWFELSFDLNPKAIEAGFEISLPEIYRK